MFNLYSPVFIFFRRTLLVLLAVLLAPLLLVASNRARFGSLFHRAWVKKGDKPVWLQSQEKFEQI